MKKLFLFILSVAALLSIVQSASFDCKKASTFIEKAICSDADASDLDEMLAQSYEKALETVSNPNNLRDKQIIWLKKVRNQCQNIKCLRSALESRIDELELIIHKSIKGVTGKYATKDGNLEITYSEGILYFELLIVNKKAHTGELEGGIVLKNNTAVYSSKEPECKIEFKFAPKEVKITQYGGCDMGANITATGTYKSMTKVNARMVIGKVGDTLGSLFYAESEKTYKKYCHVGVEENYGNIICKARKKSGEDSAHIVHIFSGDYDGAMGVLPLLSVAKKFKIISTN